MRGVDTRGGNAPSWLFSFVDLAFLLIIAMTQVGGDPAVEVLDLGEISVPRIDAEATAELPASADLRWQLRIHPAGGAELPPFELFHPEREPERLAREALGLRLAALHGGGEKKPLLAPHSDSRSQDLLDAASAVETLWPSRRRATVAPIFGR